MDKLRTRIEHLGNKGFLGVVEEGFSEVILTQATAKASLENISSVLKRAQQSGDEAKGWLINEITKLSELEAGVFMRTAKEGKR